MYMSATPLQHPKAASALPAARCYVSMKSVLVVAQIDNVAWLKLTVARGNFGIEPANFVVVLQQVEPARIFLEVALRDRPESIARLNFVRGVNGVVPLRKLVPISRTVAMEAIFLGVVIFSSLLIKVSRVVADFLKDLLSGVATGEIQRTKRISLSNVHSVPAAVSVDFVGRSAAVGVDFAERGDVFNQRDFLN